MKSFEIPIPIPSKFSGPNFSLIIPLLFPNGESAIPTTIPVSDTDGCHEVSLPKESHEIILKLRSEVPFIILIIDRIYFYECLQWKAS